MPIFCGHKQEASYKNALENKNVYKGNAITGNVKTSLEIRSTPKIGFDLPQKARGINFQRKLS